VVAVSRHRAPGVLIEMVGELIEISRNLSGRHRGEHLPRTITDNFFK
jgi:hypothetical protein